MWWLIKKLLLGKWCDHKWVTRDQGKLVEQGSNIGAWKNCQCEKCGEWKRFTLTS